MTPMVWHQGIHDKMGMQRPPLNIYSFSESDSDHWKNLWARTPEVREAAPGASGADRLRRGA